MRTQIFLASVVAGSLTLGTGCRHQEYVFSDIDNQGGTFVESTSAPVVDTTPANQTLLQPLLDENLGAGGGSLLGASPERIAARDRLAAQQAIQDARTSPATVQLARHANTADLNGDGFVTIDEVAALRSAGMTDQDILDRLRATNQIFEISTAQQAYLRERGFSETIITGMTTVNRDIRDRLLNNRADELATPPATVAPPTTAVPPLTPPPIETP